MSNIPIDPLMELFDVKYTKVQEGYVEAAFVVATKISQPFGFLHGGARIAIAESVAGVGSIFICSQDQSVFGAQVSANHISPARVGDAMLAIGTLIHRGRLTHLWNVDIVKQSDNKIVSTIRVTNQIL